MAHLDITSRNNSRSQATTWQAELYDSQANRTQVMLALMPASLILAAATALLLALV